MKITGRYHEQKLLRELLKSNKSELVAILGRRRIGKTFLINECLDDSLFFSFTGLYKGNLSEHMERFAKSLQDASSSNIPIAPQSSWFQSFDLLRAVIDESRQRKKKVIFLDEFPWMSTHKSRFLTAFTDFWNSWASKQKDIMVVISGSSASWMINKIFKNKGGLHNRVTERIDLSPFTLHETEIHLRSNGIKLDRDSIIKLYMAIGGVPFYLDKIRKGESVTQSIDRLFFAKGGFFKTEYTELFSSLFDQSEKHEAIIDTLSNSPNGLGRDTILSELKMISSGGGFTRILDELEHSGFISATVPLGNLNKGKVYKIIDPYSIFYLRYVAPNIKNRNTTWTKIAKTQSYKIWCGLAFERVCLSHTRALEKALGIDRADNTVGAWHHKGNSQIGGCQIDLLFDRDDNTINLCEIKYYNTEYTISKDYATKLKKKLISFEHHYKTRKTILLTMITSHGIKPNKHYHELVQNHLDLNSLFMPV